MCVYIPLNGRLCVATGSLASSQDSSPWVPISNLDVQKAPQHPSTPSPAQAHKPLRHEPLSIWCSQEVFFWYWLSELRLYRGLLQHTPYTRNPCSRWLTSMDGFQVSGPTDRDAGKTVNAGLLLGFRCFLRCNPTRNVNKNRLQCFFRAYRVYGALFRVYGFGAYCRFQCLRLKPKLYQSPNLNRLLQNQSFLDLSPQWFLALRALGTSVV